MQILPYKRFLQYYENSVPQAPGLIKRNSQWVANEATKYNIQTYSNQLGGGVLLDEMSIQDDLQVVKKGDTLSLVGQF